MDCGSEEEVPDLMYSSVMKGDLDKVKLLTESCGLAFSPKWFDGYALLCDALTYGQIHVAKYLIEAGSKLNHRVLDHGVALHIAVRQNLADIVNALLDRGALVDARVTFYNHGTALHEAALKGNAEITMALLHHGADVNMVTYFGKTALHLAAEKGHCMLVDVLLQNGADVNAVFEDKKQGDRTALYFAVEGRSADVVKCILKYHPDVENKGNRDALILAMYTDSEIFTSLRDHGFIVIPGDVRNILFDCIRRRDVKGLRDRIGHFTEMILRDDGRCTPLHVAARYRIKDIVRLLMDYGANVYAKDEIGKSPLIYSIKSDDLDMFNVLLTDGDGINEALCEAVKIGNVKFIKGLLKRGADVNARDQRHDLTVLHMAIAKSDLEVLNILLDHGANMESLAFVKEESDSYTALLYGVRRSRMHACEILLNRGADVNAKSLKGYSALHTATYHGSKSKHMIPLLVRHGADVNATKNGTALHTAAAAGCKDCVELLLEYGADINISSRGENSPLDCARTAWMCGRRDVLADERCVHLDTFNCLLRHLVKTAAVGFDPSSRNLEYLKPTIFNSLCAELVSIEYPSQCSNEIQVLKVEKIEGCNLTLYNLWTASKEQLVRVSKNDGFVEYLCTGNFVKQYPIYGTMLRRKVLMARKRVELENESSRILRTLHPSLAFDCVDIILTYLTTRDLELFVSTCYSYS